MLTVVPDPADRDSPGPSSLIDEIVREGARRMLAEALAAEVDAYIAQFAAERGADGRRLVVRNGCHQSREVLTSAGAVEVTEVTEVLPLLYLHGLSSGDFVPALGQFLGSGAGLSHVLYSHST